MDWQFQNGGDCAFGASRRPTAQHIFDRTGGQFVSHLKCDDRPMLTPNNSLDVFFVQRLALLIPVSGHATRFGDANIA